MSRKITYYIIVLVSLCGVTLAQTRITEPLINDYAKVMDINGNTVTLSEASSAFHPSDTVLLIQMTGIIPEDGNIGRAGIYEFHIVADVSDQFVTLQSAIDANTFFSQNPDPLNPELVQMVRVPSYKNAQIDHELNCEPWNRELGTGGVLALIVHETLTFNASIDVSGKGFTGGEAGDPYDGACIVFSSGDEGNYSRNSSDIAGYKGEGAAISSLINNTPRGYRRAWNGGGSGDGKWSGGGGGANGGAGGNGEPQVCGLDGFLKEQMTGDGNNGFAFKYNEDSESTWSKRAFMGGGGGSGTGTDATPGGNGGGIVIISAKNLRFSPNAKIYANGGSVSDAPSFGGAGGGGGGGSILLSVEDYGDIKAEVNGGKGGDVNKEDCASDYSIGAGGGGGGGFVFAAKKDILIDAPWYETSFSRNAGEKGHISANGCIEYGGNGEDGYFLGNYQIQLRGFLLNYIVSSEDTTVCYNEQATIRATNPKGGDGTTYNYTWQYATETDPSSWRRITALGDTIAILTDLDEPNAKFHFKESGVFHLQRVVRSSIGSDEVTDDGNPIIVNVRDAIDNIIVVDTAVCWKETPITIRGNNPSGGGGGPYTFQWERLLNDNGEEDVSRDLSLTWAPDDDERAYRYRRKVTSGVGCESEWVDCDVRVLPAIKNNIIVGDQDVCGNKAETLKMQTGLTLAGGATPPDYTYQWQFRAINSQQWKDINESENEDYTPELSAQEDYGEYMYRRYVASGICQDFSNEALIHFYEEPKPPVILSPDADLTGDQALRFQFSKELTAAATAGSGLWSSPESHLKFDPPDEPVTTVKDLQFGVNTIIWTVTNGVCLPQETTVLIEVNDVIIYNGFSPGDDEFNNCFRVKGVENATSSELIILDRSNKIVWKSDSFKGNDSSDPRDCTGWWDGRNSSGKELPSGTYFYQLTLNRNKVYKGYVVLKRQ